MVLWKGVDGSHLATRLYDYASMLASQGCLATALNYLTPLSSDDVRSTCTQRITTIYYYYY